MIVFKLTVKLVNVISNGISKIMIKIRKNKDDKNLGKETIIPQTQTTVEEKSEFSRPEVKVWGSK